MKIVTDKNKIEHECDFVYFKDGVTIVRKLLSVCLYGKNKDCIGLAHNQIGGDKKVFVAKLDNKWCAFINAEIIGRSNSYNIDPLMLPKNRIFNAKRSTKMRNF